MAWIEADQKLRDHNKTKKAARQLGINIPTMIGHLFCLWWWCLDYAEDGNLSTLEIGDIAEAARWEGDPQLFVDALVNCGPANKPGFLVDKGNGLEVNSWEEYGGKYIAKRNQGRERQRAHRARKVPNPETPPNALLTQNNALPNTYVTKNNALVTRDISVSNAPTYDMIPYDMIPSDKSVYIPPKIQNLDANSTITHPTIKVYMEESGAEFTPNLTQMKAIIETVTDLERWRATVKRWIMSNYRNDNVLGMLEQYTNPDKKNGGKSARSRRNNSSAAETVATDTEGWEPIESTKV